MLGWGDFWTCGFAQVWISKPNLYSIFGSHEVIHWASLGTQSLVCWLKIWSQQTWKLKAVLQEKKFKSSVASSEIYFQEVRNWRGSGGWGGSFIYNVMQILKENRTLENNFGGCQRSDWDAAPFYDDQRQTRVEKNISKANDCDRGLAAYLFTTDYSQVLPLIQEIQNLYIVTFVLTVTWKSQ